MQRGNKRLSLDLPRAARVLAAGCWQREVAVAVITLAFDDRHRRRLRMKADDGFAFLLDLPAAVILNEGDGLLLEDGRVVRVQAALEPVCDITAPTAADLMRFAWHMGNRHTPIQVVAGGGFRIREDAVLVDMLVRLGATIVRSRQPFSPEAGAYTHIHTHTPTPTPTPTLTRAHGSS